MPEGPPAVHAPGVHWGEWFWEPVDSRYKTSFWQHMFFDDGTPGAYVFEPDPAYVFEPPPPSNHLHLVAAQAEEPRNTTGASEEEVGWRGVPAQDDDPEETPVEDFMEALDLRLGDESVPGPHGSTVVDSVDLEESQVDAPRIAYLQDDLQQVLQERAELLDDIGQLVDDILGEPEEGMGPWREQPWFHLCYRSEPEFVSAYEEHRRTRTWRAGAMALASGLSPKKGRGCRK